MLLHSRAAALMAKRSSARVAVSSSMVMNNMKSTTRKYSHSHSSKAIVTNNCYTASDNKSNNNGSVFSISMTTSRTMSSKPCFAWEEKRVEVTNAEELQRRLDRIKVCYCYYFLTHTPMLIRSQGKLKSSTNSLCDTISFLCDSVFSCSYVLYYFHTATIR